MTMSRQHFQLIAETIRDGREYFASNTGHAQFAADVAARLADTNANFDRARFIAAAMPAAWVGTNKSTPWERIAAGDRY